MPRAILLRRTIGLYDGARVAEEWEVPAVGSPTLSAIYVYGLYIDEVLTMRRGAVDYYYHADDQHNVVKLTDSAGAVLEAYDYGDYGLPEFFDPAGALLSATTSQFGNHYLFTGRRWDDELRYYYFRNRYLDPVHGRFASRDPLGLWGDPLNLGNGYTYAASNPWSLVDPMGLDACQEGGNSSSVSTGSSFWEILKFFFSAGPEDQLSSDGADWTRFSGAGSGDLRESDHESRVLRANDENQKLAEKLALDGVEIALTESGARAVGVGIAAGTEVAGAALDSAKKGILRRGADWVKGKWGRKPHLSGKWKNADGRIMWPPNRGFAGNPEKAGLTPGMRLDRYGYEGGTFVSPEGIRKRPVKCIFLFS